MKQLGLILGITTLLLSATSMAATGPKEESFNKVKNLYIGHMQQKIIFMSEMTRCMAKGKSFKDLKLCSEDGKAKIAKLEKVARDAHLRAQKKKKK